MVVHFKKTQTLDFNMEDRLAKLLDSGKARQLTQVACDAMKEDLVNDESSFGIAFTHYDNFYSSTNETLFDDLHNLHDSDCKDMVLKLLLKKQ